MRRRRAIRIAVVVLVALAIVLAFAAIAMARPGGGSSYSGGGSRGGGGGYSSRGGGGGGGGGGDGGAGGFLIGLIFSALPWPVKLLILVAIIAFVVMRFRASDNQKDWSSSLEQIEAARERTEDVPMREQAHAIGVRAQLEAIRAFDPAFSLVLFEDFLYALYAETKYAQGRGQLAMLSAYLAPEVLASLQAAHAVPVTAVIVGAMHWTSASGTDAASHEVNVDVEIESNVGLASPSGERSAYLVERWTLTRKRGAKSRPAARARVLDCPSCGAPLSAVIAGKCTHCNKVVATGELDWLVRRAVIVQDEPRAPILGGDAEEEGTDLPTIVDPRASQRLDALRARDPSFSFAAFEQRVALVFTEFQVAWSTRDLVKMRPFLSDNLFQMQEYWVKAYRAQGLRNVTERTRIEGIELARVESDATYDAITVRLRATGLDYTLRDSDGKVAAGSRSRERRYTEYWTLIRGTARRAPTQTERACPNCGAPLEVNMAGICKFCSVKVTTGEFDWVLSRIEQDESYTG